MKVNSDVIEISFYDLNNEAQQEFLKIIGMDTPSDGNYDVFPIALVPIPEEPDLP